MRPQLPRLLPRQASATATTRPSSPTTAHFSTAAISPLGYNRGGSWPIPSAAAKKSFPLEELPPRGDAVATNIDLFTPDSSWIAYHAVVSTSRPDCISPGYLKREWQQDGRNYFEYSMGRPRLQDFFSYISGRYAVKRDNERRQSGDLSTTPSHKYNLDKMIASSKAGLEYYPENSALPVPPVPRPRVSRATAVCAIIPQHRSLFRRHWLHRPPRKAGRYRLLCYVTAHELAHQWWGHQLVGGLKRAPT